MVARIQPIPRTGHPRRPRGLRWRPSERVLFGLLGFVLVIPLWEAVSALGLVKKVLLSSPSLIVQTGIKDTVSGVIWPHLVASGSEFAVGFGAALLVGIPLGLLLGWFRRLDHLIEPWLAALYATPTIALIPLIILIAGIGLTSKAIVVWLESVVVIVVSTVAGMKATDVRHLDIASSFGASQWLTFRTVMLPTSVPFILTGFRLGVGRALVGVVVAEFIAANVGIGFYINVAGSSLQSARVFFGIILIGLFGIVLGELVRRLERRFDRWRPELA